MPLRSAAFCCCSGVWPTSLAGSGSSWSARCVFVPPPPLPAEPSRLILRESAPQFIFGSFNIACGCAQTLIQLAVFRALTGVGAAAAIPAGAGIIAQTFPPSSRARQIAFTIFSAGAPVGSGLGSTFGGVFTQFSTWRGVFFLTAGLAYVPMVLGWFTIDHDVLDPKRDKRVDWLGGLLSTAGITLLTFGLSAGPTAPDRWATPYVVVSLALGAVLVLAFLAWEHLLVRLDRFTLKPLMPLEIWTRARLGPALGVLALSWAAFNPNLYHTTLFFQKYLELSPIEATVRFLPTAIVGILVNFVFAVLVPYVYGWVLISFGCISGAVRATALPLFSAQRTTDTPPCHACRLRRSSWPSSGPRTRTGSGRSRH